MNADGLQHGSEMLFSNRTGESFVSRCGLVWGRGMGWEGGVLTSDPHNVHGSFWHFPVFSTLLQAQGAAERQLDSSSLWLEANPEKWDR